MNVLKKIKSFINTEEFLGYLISLVLSTLFLGYAPSSIALGIFIMFSVRYLILNKNNINFDFSLFLPVLMYFVFFLTLFWSVNQNLTKTGLERTVAFLLVPAAFSFIPRISLKNLEIILKCFTISNALLGFFFLILALINFSEIKSISVFVYHDLVSVLDLNAIYVSVAFSISLFYLLSKNKKKWKHFILIIYFLILLFLLSSKTIFFILLFGLIVYPIFYKIKGISKGKLILVTLLVLLFLGIGSISLKERFLDESESKFSEVLSKEEFGKVYLWTGSSIRLLQLRILKDQIKEESIFWKGFGLFASRDNIKERHLKFNTYPEFHKYNYHNQYAQIFSETGIFGVILFFLILLTSFIKALKTNNFVAIMFNITMVIVFITESYLWRQHGLFLFISFYCVFNRLDIKNT